MNLVLMLCLVLSFLYYYFYYYFSFAFVSSLFQIDTNKSITQKRPKKVSDPVTVFLFLEAPLAVLAVGLFSLTGACCGETAEPECDISRC